MNSGSVIDSGIRISSFVIERAPRNELKETRIPESMTNAQNPNEKA
jgi:hypothetical protein